MISKEKVREYRILKGFSQEKLSVESGLSLRTIQRIEKGTTEGSPYTLQSLSDALGVTNQDLLEKKEESLQLNNHDLQILKNINLSALSLILLPLGNLLFPFISYQKYRSDKSIKLRTKKILSLQIIWSLASFFLLLVSPFIRHPINFIIGSDFFSAHKMPLLTYLFLVAFNVIITLKVAHSLNTKKDLPHFIPDIL